MSYEERETVADDQPVTGQPEAVAETAQETIDQVAQPAPSAMVEEVDTLRKQVADFREGWQRERADFANYRRRAEAQIREIGQTATVETLLLLLPIIDDFERAMSNVPAELDGHVWLNGVAAIQRKFQKLLDDQGIMAIDPVGQPFDPTRHEAVGMEESNQVESGHVTSTLQKGYARGERILRPALVRVAN